MIGVRHRKLLFAACGVCASLDEFHGRRCSSERYAASGDSRPPLRRFWAHWLSRRAASSRAVRRRDLPWSANRVPPALRRASAQHFVAQLREHAADFAVLALVPSTIRSVAFSPFAFMLDALGFTLPSARKTPVSSCCKSSFVGNPRPEPSKSSRRRTCVHQPVRQIAVVGHQQQAFAVLIEAADGVDALIDMGNRVDGERAATGRDSCTGNARLIPASRPGVPSGSAHRQRKSFWASGSTRMPSSRTLTPSMLTPGR